MTTTNYPNGHGLREKPPQCQQTPATVECPCCKAQQEHPFGAGMDADAVTCQVCNGYGYLIVSIPHAAGQPDQASQPGRALTLDRIISDLDQLLLNASHCHHLQSKDARMAARAVITARGVLEASRHNFEQTPEPASRRNGHHPAQNRPPAGQPRRTPQAQPAPTPAFTNPAYANVNHPTQPKP